MFFYIYKLHEYIYYLTIYWNIKLHNVYVAEQTNKKHLREMELPVQKGANDIKIVIIFVCVYTGRPDGRFNRKKSFQCFIRLSPLISDNKKRRALILQMIN